MSLDDPSLGSLKWGEPVLGVASGTIGWSADLTGLVSGGGFSEEAFEVELASAFERWEEVASIDFVEVPQEDAVVTFSMGEVGGAAGLARVSYYETGTIDQLYFGEITLDIERSWTPEGTTGGADFFAVALHEIGHILGLSHVDDPTAIMNAVIRTDDLGVQDVEAIRALYGEGDGSGVSSPPPPDGNSALASSDDGGSSGGAAGLLLGALAALFAMLFGGPGAAAALVAAGRLDDDEDIPGVDPDDLPPQIYVDEHLVYLAGDGFEHAPGCGCGCCGDTVDDDVEAFFV